MKGIFPGAEVVQQPDWQLEGSKGEKYCRGGIKDMLLSLHFTAVA